MTQTTPTPGPPSAEGKDADLILRYEFDRLDIVFRRDNELWESYSQRGRSRTAGFYKRVEKCIDHMSYEPFVAATPEPEQPPPGYWCQPLNHHPNWLLRRKGIKTKPFLVARLHVTKAGESPALVTEVWCSDRNEQIGLVDEFYYSPCRPPEPRVAERPAGEESSAAVKLFGDRIKKASWMAENDVRVVSVESVLIWGSELLNNLGIPDNPAEDAAEEETNVAAFLTAVEKCCYEAQGSRVVDWHHVQSFAEKYLGTPSPSAGDVAEETSLAYAMKMQMDEYLELQKAEHEKEKEKEIARLKAEWREEVAAFKKSIPQGGWISPKFILARIDECFGESEGDDG